MIRGDGQWRRSTSQPSAPEQQVRDCMGLSHATGLGRLQAGGLDGRTQPAGPRLREAQQHMPNTLAGCRALHSPTRACRMPSGRFAQVACVSDRNRCGSRANCCGRGRAVPASEDQYSSRSLCPHFPSTLLLLTAFCMVRSGCLFHQGPSCWDLSPINICKGPEDAGVPWMKLATVSRLQ